MELKEKKKEKRIKPKKMGSTGAQQSVSEIPGKEFWVLTRPNHDV